MNKPEKVFITGSNGFIGSALVESLRAQGQTVRGLARSPREPAPGVEYVQGDLLEIESLRRGMEGCQYVFHLGAYAKNWSRNRETFHDINVRGTRNVFTVAKEQEVRRIVWTSTIVTLGPTPPGEVYDESSPRSREDFLTEYEESKTVMEREAARWVEEGLPLVIVNPTRVFGPGVLSESNTVTQLIRMHRKGRVPILFNLGKNVGNYVLVDDVVRGHLLAMERGRIGERYILGGDNVSLKEFFRAIDRLDGKKRFQLPIFWVWPMIIAYIFQINANLFGIYPPFTPGWIRTFLVDWAFSSNKAQKELGYDRTPFEEAIRQTCTWLDQGPSVQA